MTEHTPTPWFVSGVRFRMNGGEWQSINRYDEAKKRDENIACIGYDARTGVGLKDAHFIVKAVNNHDRMVKAFEALRDDVSVPAWIRTFAAGCLPDPVSGAKGSETP
jgi:hypothetical protein